MAQLGTRVRERTTRHGAGRGTTTPPLFASHWPQHAQERRKPWCPATAPSSISPLLRAPIAFPGERQVSRH
eukprot:10880523-Lingulodinium_polyedra.AAC.1